MFEFKVVRPRDPQSDHDRSNAETDARLIADCVGPAVLVDQDSHVVAANRQGSALCQILAHDDGHEMRRLVDMALERQRMQQGSIRLPTELGGVALDVAVIPLIGTGAAVLGRDCTADRNMIEALVASRRLFKDLVNCSSDFAWQTDATGAFDYVSPRGALGYGAHELNGLSPRTLSPEDRPMPQPIPFEAHEPISEVEAWLRRKDGTAACLIVSSVPVVDEQGRWRGSRGVCRDVTEEREQRAALERANRRTRLEYEIVNAIRTELAPERMLQAAAESTAGAISAMRVLIWRIGKDGEILRAGDTAGGDDGTAEKIVAAANAAARQTGPVRPILETTMRGRPVLIAGFEFRGVTKGGVCAIGSNDLPQWGEDESELMGRVAAHLGIAVAQIEAYESLAALSRTDELTGLMNRRAFMEEVTQRLAHQRRTGRDATLLYVDLDNFKPVNDRLGHQEGDAVLKRFARILKENSRIGDLAVRLGGDEFALWLEEAEEAGARKKAQALVDSSDQLSERAAAAGIVITLSIGLAATVPTAGETADQLIARADTAMYQAKHSGKGKYCVANPPAPATDD